MSRPVVLNPSRGKDNQTARQALLEVLGFLAEHPDMKVVIAYDWKADDAGYWSSVRNGGPEGALTSNERLGMLSFAAMQVYEHVTGG